MSEIYCEDNEIRPRKKFCYMPEKAIHRFQQSVNFNILVPMQDLIYYLGEKEKDEYKRLIE